MILDDKNQNDIINSELINSHDIEYIFSNKPINRIKTKPKVEEKSYLLDGLRKKIENNPKIPINILTIRGEGYALPQD